VRHGDRRRLQVVQQANGRDVEGSGEAIRVDLPMQVGDVGLAADDRSCHTERRRLRRLAGFAQELSDDRFQVVILAARELF
jgi:hypothetical protein